MQHAFNNYGLGPGQGLGQTLGDGPTNQLQQWNIRQHQHQSKYRLSLSLNVLHTYIKTHFVCLTTTTATTITTTATTTTTEKYSPKSLIIRIIERFP